MGSDSENLAGRTRAGSGSISHEADAEVRYFIHFLKILGLKSLLIE